MEQMTLNLEGNPFKSGSQNHRLLEALRQGPILNYQIIAMHILSYTRRISDLRDKGFDVVAEPQGGGVVEYKLRRGNHERL